MKKRNRCKKNKSYTDSVPVDQGMSNHPKVLLFMGRIQFADALS